MDIITKPRLDAERLEVIKGQYVSRMKRRFDAPGRAVRVLSDQVLHGDDPRLGYTPAKSEIEAVNREDIRRLADRYLGADNLYVTAVGDFDRAELIAMLERRLGAWQKAQNAEREWLERAPALRPGAFVVEKDIPQPAVVLVQEIAVDRSAPPEEHAAMEILNEILGGSGFRSRLMERLRSDEGLTYGIYSSFFHDSREGVPGQMNISYQTNKDAVARSIESVMDVYRGVLAEGVTADEVSEQIQSWRNNFIFRFENPFGSVSRLMSLELDDRPYDHDRQRLAAIEAVTPEAVLAAAKKYLDPGKLSICVFGSLTPEDETALGERYGLNKLAKEEVFKGGY
jgi:zinc protease